MELKRYEFYFNVLDEHGQEKLTRLADDDDVEERLDRFGPGSPSEHLHQLTLAEMDQHPQLDYRQALARVQTRRPDLVRLHASESAGRLRVY